MYKELHSDKSDKKQQINLSHFVIHTTYLILNIFYHNIDTVCQCIQKFTQKRNLLLAYNHNFFFSHRTKNIFCKLTLTKLIFMSCLNIN